MYFGLTVQSNNLTIIQTQSVENNNAQKIDYINVVAISSINDI